jgi:Ion channel
VLLQRPLSLRRLRRHRYLILLLVLLASIVLGMSSSEHAYLRESMISVMMTLVMLIVFDHHLMRVLSLFAGGCVLCGLWLMRLVPAAQLQGLEVAIHLGGVLFFALAVGMVLRHLFERRAVSVDDILGSVCGYLMAALAWANVFALIEVLAPGSFLVTAPDQASLTQWHERESLFTYFSLTTLTTIGYGDVTPVAPLARSVAMLEGVFGQFYIAVVVAQLVGSKLAEANAREPSDRR